MHTIVTLIAHSVVSNECQVVVNHSTVRSVTLKEKSNNKSGSVYSRNNQTLVILFSRFLVSGCDVASLLLVFAYTLNCTEITLLTAHSHPYTYS